MLQNSAYQFLKEKTNISVYYDFDSPMLQNIAYQFSEGKKIIYQFIIILIVPYYKIVSTSCATALFPGVRGGGRERRGGGLISIYWQQNKGN